MKALQFFAAGVSATTAIGAAAEGRFHVAFACVLLFALNLWFALQRRA